jgi:hypothetical protein
MTFRKKVIEVVQLENRRRRIQTKFRAQKQLIQERKDCIKPWRQYPEIERGKFRQKFDKFNKEMAQSCMQSLIRHERIHNKVQEQRKEPQSK